MSLIERESRLKLARMRLEIIERRSQGTEANEDFHNMNRACIVILAGPFLS